MAACYSSSASAPLHALASQFLGESSASAKTAHFRSHPPSHISGYNDNISHSHARHQKHHQRLFPSSGPGFKSAHEGDKGDLLEQTWSSSLSSQSSHLRTSAPEHLWHSQFNSQQHQPHHALHTPFPQRHLPDLDLISSWDRAVQDNPSAFSVANSTSSVQHTEALGNYLSEFRAFHHEPEAEPSLSNFEAAWSKGVPAQRTEEDEDEEEDEFREEWNNDHFTQAYINNHPTQFQQIEEQERQKEARLAEERERQRLECGVPLRPSGWMNAGMSGSLSSSASARSSAMIEVAYGTGQQQQQSRRLRVPGIDEEEEGTRSIDFVNDFLQSEEKENRSVQLPSKEQRPIYAGDRFMSLVSDLHLAEQIFYPGAASEKELSGDMTDTRQVGSIWAREFDIEQQHEQEKNRRTRQVHKYLGAEWSWEKLFGKDPRKEQARALAVDTSGQQQEQQDESERLKSVALARLQALFGHLSLTPAGS